MSRIIGLVCYKFMPSGPCLCMNILNIILLYDFTSAIKQFNYALLVAMFFIITMLSKTVFIGW